MGTACSKFWVTGQVLQQPLEEPPVFAPTGKMPEYRVPVSKPLAQITPWRACAGQPQRCFQKQTIVGFRPPGGVGFAGWQRRDAVPLRISQNLSIQGRLC